MKTTKTTTRKYIATKFHWTFFATLLTLAIHCHTVYGMNEEDTRKRAVLIFSAIKNSLWNNSPGSSEFVIAIVGDSELHSYLNYTYRNKLKDGKRIVFEYYANALTISKKCKAIYLHDSQSSELDHILLSQRKSLIITSHEGLAKKGSAMNLIYRNGKLHFEVNKKSLELSSIQLSSEFMLMAIPVR
jgi:hypothetical protein